MLLLFVAGLLASIGSRPPGRPAEAGRQEADAIWLLDRVTRTVAMGGDADQRAMKRPVLFDVPRPPGGDGSDIGAYELQKTRRR